MGGKASSGSSGSIGVGTQVAVAEPPAASAEAPQTRVAAAASPVPVPVPVAAGGGSSGPSDAAAAWALMEINRLLVSLLLSDQRPIASRIATAERARAFGEAFEAVVAMKPEYDALLSTVCGPSYRRLSAENERRMCDMLGDFARLIDPFAAEITSYYADVVFPKIQACAEPGVAIRRGKRIDELVVKSAAPLGATSLDRLRSAIRAATGLDAKHYARPCSSRSTVV